MHRYAHAAVLAWFVASAGCSEVQSGGAKLSTLLPELQVPAELAFGEVLVGTSATLTLTIHNAGDGRLLITEWRTIGDSAFALEVPAPEAVGSADSAEARVTFAPTAAGPLTGTVILLTNDTEARLAEVALSGHGVLPCADGDDDGFGDNCALGPDCDDGDADLNPETPWFADGDQDGFGDASTFVLQCDAPAGYVRDASDCDDGDPQVAPHHTWYIDGDDDGFGHASDVQRQCDPPAGYVDNAADCDDGSGAIAPGATELCDNLDNDCNGTADDGCDDDGDDLCDAAMQYVPGPVGVSVCPAGPGDCDDEDMMIGAPGVWFLDDDDDGFGDPDVSVIACTAPADHVADDTDCDDQNPAAHVDTAWYEDRDSDMIGDANVSQSACGQPVGYVATAGDCDDDDPAVQADVVWYLDDDDDTFGDPQVSVTTCHAPMDYVDNDGDCDDTDPAVNPNADESGATLCNDGIDNDCDGEPDSFDSACLYLDCGDPADAHNTLVCNPEYPANTGAQLCEEYPNSPWPVGSQEQCMPVCRTRSECPAGQACYPSRRSLNLHFCAPVLGQNLAGRGEACQADADCESALCHSNVCREVCVRDADCGGGAFICRAEIRNHAYIGNDIATGICVPRNPSLLPLGASCTSGPACQTGLCSQASLSGPYLCRKPCGSASDCGIGERCAPSIYDNDPNIGFGMRTCGPSPAGAFATIGEDCTFLGQIMCDSYFCDGTYEPVVPSYCNGHCDADDDCPRLFPAGSNLRMRCAVSSSAVHLPLIGGYCLPWWCNGDPDCPSGSSCFIFNPGGSSGPPQGICQ